MGAGRLPRRSCALSPPPPPPPPLLEPLPLLEQPPGPQHVSERAEPAAQAPNTHPTPLPLPQANLRSLASDAGSQSGQRHAPRCPPPSPPPQLPAASSHPQLGGSGESAADLPASASRAPAGAWKRTPFCTRRFGVQFPQAPCGGVRLSPAPLPAPGAPTLSCAPVPSALLLPPAFGSLLRPRSPGSPSTSGAQIASRRARAPFRGEGTWAFSKPRERWTACARGLEEFGGEIVPQVGQPSGVSVKPFLLVAGTVSPRPASPGDRKRVVAVRGNFPAERLAKANRASVRNALRAPFSPGACVPVR